jgi:hypothetical protein
MCGQLIGDRIPHHPLLDRDHYAADWAAGPWHRGGSTHGPAGGKPKGVLAGALEADIAVARVAAHAFAPNQQIGRASCRQALARFVVCPLPAGFTQRSQAGFVDRHVLNHRPANLCITALVSTRLRRASHSVSARPA